MPDSNSSGERQTTTVGKATPSRPRPRRIGSPPSYEEWHNRWFDFGCNECDGKFSTQEALDRHLRSKDHQFEYEDQVEIFGSKESGQSPMSEIDGWKITDPLEAEHIHDGSTDSDSWKMDRELRMMNFTRGDEMNAEFLKWLEDLSRLDRHEIQEIIKSSPEHPLLKDISKPRLSRSTFKYEELRTTDDTIRLLVLWPSANHDDELERSLADATLAQRIRYNALSYAWGENPICNNSIRLNGKLFYVTRRLHSALLDLRGPSDPVVLWVDALCINQESHLESNT
jgi:hypothetical protein